MHVLGKKYGMASALSGSRKKMLEFQKPESEEKVKDKLYPLNL